MSIQHLILIAIYLSGNRKKVKRMKNYMISKFSLADHAT